MDGRVTRIDEAPHAWEYLALRETLGWPAVDVEVARKTLGAATFTTCLRDAERLVGLLRIVGDGALFLHIAEVMVDPSHNGRGLGGRLMSAAIEYIDRSATAATTVTLVPLAGLEGFYERFGFERCPVGPFGVGMARLPDAARPGSAGARSR